MMYMLFTYSRSPVSWLIRKITGECVSHVAIQAGETVIHSSVLGGLQMISAKEFLAKNTVVFRVQIEYEPMRLMNLYTKYSDARYDFGALVYLFLRYVVPSRISKQNLWQTTGMYMCTEWGTKYLYGEEDSLITPYKLYLRLVNNNKKKQGAQ